MKINKELIINLTEKYDDCMIEEIYENHEIMGNWCIITCNLPCQNVESEHEIEFIGGIFDLVLDLMEYENIHNFNEETYQDFDGREFYEYVSFEWTL